MQEEQHDDGRPAAAVVPRTTGHGRRHRALQEDENDFAALNVILQNVAVVLPQTSTVSSGGITMDLYNIMCTSFRLDDASVVGTKATTTTTEEVPITVSISGLTMTCQARYDYSGPLGVGGRGDVTLVSEGNAATATGTVFVGDDTNTVRYDSCQPTIIISDLDFSDGGIVSWVLDTVEGLLRGTIQTLAEEKVCSALQDALEDASAVLQHIQTTVWDEYDPFWMGFVDPLERERSILLVVAVAAANNNGTGTAEYAGAGEYGAAEYAGATTAANTTTTTATTPPPPPPLLDLQTQDTAVGGWIKDMLVMAVDFLNRPVATTTTGQQQTELQVNQLLRQFFLTQEEEGTGLGGTQAAALVLNAQDILQGTDGGVIFEGHDNLTQTTVRLDQVRLMGLDTITQFNPFDAIGRYTLETDISWTYLRMEADMTITIKPSTLPGSLIVVGDDQNTDDAGVVEQVKLVFGVDDVLASTALLAAVDQDRLENIRLGSLLVSDHVVGCFLSTMWEAQFTRMAVTAADVSVPTSTGLVSPGLDRVVGDMLAAAFVVYKAKLLESAPTYFQREIRPVLNQQLVQRFLGPTNNYCVPYAGWAKKGYVDFRDLLLPAEEAAALGGSGDDQYGDVISTRGTPYIREQLKAETFNTQWVRPFTKEQSGSEGTLVFDNVLSYDRNASSLFDYLDFDVSKLTISNLDTVVDPLQVLQPTGESNVVINTLFLDGENGADGSNRSLTVTARVSLSIGGDQSPLQMKNEVDFSLSIPSTSLTIGILANVREKSFFKFPLKDVPNLYCWLAALGPDLDDDGRGPSQSGATGTANSAGGGFRVGNSMQTEPPVEGTNDIGLDITELAFTLSTFFLNATCVSASSPGCDSISEVLQRLDQAGLAPSFRESIAGLVEDAIWFLWDDFNSRGLLQESHKYCPHSESYNPQAPAPTLELPSLSGISSNSTETIVSLGIVAMQAAMVVSAKNQLLSDAASQNDQIVLQQQEEDVLETSSKTFPEGEGIVNWMNISDSLGTWVAIAFDEFREFIATSVSPETESGRRSTEATPRANVLLRDFVLDDSGTMTIDVDGMAFTALGLSLSITEARIRGLDTLSGFDPLVVIDPHTLRTTMKLEELTVALLFNVTTMKGDTDQIELEYSLMDVSIVVDTMIALNVTEMGHVRLGSIFEVDKIVNCMMRGVQAFQVPNLNFSMTDISQPIVRGYLSEGRRDAVSGILESLHEEYKVDIIQAFPSMFASTFREMINLLIPQQLESMAMRCPSPPQYPASSLIDFRELLLSETDPLKPKRSGSSKYGNLFSLLYDMLEKEVMQSDASNRPLLNDLLRTATEQQSNVSGTIAVAGSAVESQTVLEIAGLKADLGIQISNVLIQNLDSIGDPLHLLRPVPGDPNFLNNTLSFGVDSKPVTFTATLVISLNDGAEMQIRNEINVSFSLEDVTIHTTLLVQVLENSISLFPFEDFSDWNCWASTILPASTRDATMGGISLMDQSYSTGNFTMNITCISCTSPDFDDLLKSLYAPQDITDAIQQQASSLMDAGFAQTALQSVVLDSKKRCPHHPEFDPSYVSQGDVSTQLSSAVLGFGGSGHSQNPPYFNIANSIIAACLIIIGIAGKVMIAHRNRKWVNSLSFEGRSFLCSQQDKQTAMENWLDKNTTSLFASPHIPRSIRWGVPVAIIVNIGIFLGAQLGLLCVVNLDVTLAGESFTIYNFLEFSFLESTKNTYNTGGATMAIFLFIFAGIWPHVKLVMSLLVWMMPPSRLGVKRRGTVLLWLDALATLSVVDIFTLVLGIAVLLVFIGGPDDSVSGDGVYYALQAIIVPKAACYCFIAAQRMSRVSSRFLLEYHDGVVDGATKMHREREGDLSICQSIREEDNHECDDDIVPPSIRLTDRDQEEDIAGGPRLSSTDDMLQNRPIVHRNGRVSSTLPSDEGSISLALSDAASSTSESSSKEIRWGYWGAILAAITIFLVFIVGCVFAPAVSFDLSSFSESALESGATYEDAVSEYGVFLVVSAILVNARFVLKTKADYIGMGLMLTAAGICMLFVFALQSYQFIKRKMRERRERRGSSVGPSYGHKGCGLPSYFRLFKWNHMEIYLISVIIGVWQLGSIASYSIHSYCNIMEQIYEVLTYLGIATASAADCDQIQATMPGNLIIIIGAFFILSISFSFQALAQYKKNIADCMKNVDDRDVPSLSLAWSEDKGKDSRCSHLTESTSHLSNIHEDDEFGRSSRAMSSAPCSPGDTSTPSSSESCALGTRGRGTSYTTNDTTSAAAGRPDGQSPTSPTSPNPSQLESTRSMALLAAVTPPTTCSTVAMADFDPCPVASPCSVRSRSSTSSRSANANHRSQMTAGQLATGEADEESVIDATCELVSSASPTPSNQEHSSPNISNSAGARGNMGRSWIRDSNDVGVVRSGLASTPPPTLMPRRRSADDETDMDLEVPSSPPTFSPTSSSRSRGSLFLPSLRSTSTRQASPSPSRSQSIRRVTNSSDYLQFMERQQQQPRQPS